MMHNKARLLYTDTQAAAALGGFAASPSIGEMGGGCEAAARNTSNARSTGDEMPRHRAVPDDVTTRSELLDC